MHDHFRRDSLVFTFAGAGVGLSLALLTLPWKPNGVFLGDSVLIVLFSGLAGWAAFNPNGIVASARQLNVSNWLLVQLFGSALACGYLALLTMFSSVMVSAGLLLPVFLLGALTLLWTQLNRVFAVPDRPGRYLTQY